MSTNDKLEWPIIGLLAISLVFGVVSWAAQDPPTPGVEVPTMSAFNTETSTRMKGATYDVRQWGAVGNYTTADATAIQNALNYIGTKGGGNLRLDAGLSGRRTFGIGTTLTVPANVRLFGGGLIKRNQVWHGVMLQNKDHNVFGAYSAAGNIVIEGLSFDDKQNHSAIGDILAFGHSWNVRIKDCNLYNNYTSGHAIDITGSADVKITGNTAMGGTGNVFQIDTADADSIHGIKADGRASDGVLIEGNTIKGVNKTSTGRVAVHLHRAGSKNIRIIGNDISNCGLGFYNDTNCAASDILIAGNQIHDCYNGIGIEGHPSRMDVLSNQFYNITRDVYYQYCASSRASQIRVTGNACTSVGSGIYIRNVDGVVVKNNTITSTVGTSLANSVNGVRVSNVTDFHVDNNDIIGTRNQFTGIYINGTSYNGASNFNTMHGCSNGMKVGNSIGQASFSFNKPFNCGTSLTYPSFDNSTTMFSRYNYFGTTGWRKLVSATTPNHKVSLFTNIGSVPSHVDAWLQLKNPVNEPTAARYRPGTFVAYSTASGWCVKGTSFSFSATAMTIRVGNAGVLPGLSDNGTVLNNMSGWCKVDYWR